MIIVEYRLCAIGIHKSVMCVLYHRMSCNVASKVVHCFCLTMLLLERVDQNKTRRIVVALKLREVENDRGGISAVVCITT